MCPNLSTVARAFLLDAGCPVARLVAELLSDFTSECPKVLDVWVDDISVEFTGCLHLLLAPLKSPLKCSPKSLIRSFT